MICTNAAIRYQKKTGNEYSIDMVKKCISWRRVSTFKQNRSGLGLEAQSEIIRYFIEREGGELIADYAECYTGKELSGCTELRKAMNHAKKENAVLVIAKSDRFRNCQEALGILSEMGEGNLEFCDLPHSDRFTLTLFWALAEREALITSIRTKQALAALKARGDVKLGAASVKYKINRQKKDKDLIKQEDMDRGQSKREHWQASRDVQTFLKVLKRVQPEHCTAEDPKDWEWGGINSKCGRREQMLQLMKDFKEMDAEGKLFRRWNLANIHSRQNQMRLCAFIQRTRTSFTNG